MPVFRKDPCGFFCIIMTYGAVLYADYVVVRWLETLSQARVRTDLWFLQVDSAADHVREPLGQFPRRHVQHHHLLALHGSRQGGLLRPRDRSSAQPQDRLLRQPQWGGQHCSQGRLDNLYQVSQSSHQHWCLVSKTSPCQMWDVPAPQSPPLQDMQTLHTEDGPPLSLDQ